VQAHGLAGPRSGYSSHQRQSPRDAKSREPPAHGYGPPSVGAQRAEALQ
jgi:hypothetical protein